MTVSVCLYTSYFRTVVFLIVKSDSYFLDAMQCQKIFKITYQEFFKSQDDVFVFATSSKSLKTSEKLELKHVCLKTVQNSCIVGIIWKYRTCNIGAGDSGVRLKGGMVSDEHTVYCKALRTNRNPLLASFSSKQVYVIFCMHGDATTLLQILCCPFPKLSPLIETWPALRSKSHCKLPSGAHSQ